MLWMACCIDFEKTRKGFICLGRVVLSYRVNAYIGLWFSPVFIMFVINGHFIERIKNRFPIGNSFLGHIEIWSYFLQKYFFLGNRSILLVGLRACISAWILFLAVFPELEANTWIHKFSSSHSFIPLLSDLFMEADLPGRELSLEFSVDGII